MAPASYEESCMSLCFPDPMKEVMGQAGSRVRLPEFSCSSTLYSQCDLEQVSDLSVPHL